MFNDNKPYDRDKPLLAELGLTEWTANEREEVYIGTVEGDNGASIEIYVECLPAQFYRFRVVDCEENTAYSVRTGSGALSDFWPSVKMIMDSMLVVTLAEF